MEPDTIAVGGEDGGLIVSESYRETKGRTSSQRGGSGATRCGEEVSAMMQSSGIDHLIYVSLKGPWFYINGEPELRFKTRGNNRQDLFNALQKYDIDYWESDFEQVVRDMASQLWAQARAKNERIKLEAIA